MKLLDALAQLYPDSSKRTLKQMLASKRVTVDGKIAIKPHAIVEPNQDVRVGRLLPKIHPKIELLYEDDDLVVINKGEGLLSFPLDEGYKTNALQLLQEHYNTSQIEAVHRIDRGTSGVLAFAKGKRCTKELMELFRNHDLKREYLAIVAGHLQDDQGTWKSRLVEDSVYSVHAHPSKGRLCITHFQVLKRSNNFTYLRLRLDTGRKHQIRVHCKEAGHPVVGDKRYGDPACDPIKRMALHAATLAFIHPRTGKPMHFSAPLPPAMRRLGFPL